MSSPWVTKTRRSHRRARVGTGGRFTSGAQEKAEGLISVGKAAAVLDLPRPIANAVVRIDGQPWTAFSWFVAGVEQRRPWYTLKNLPSEPCAGGVLVDLSDLPLGVHQLEIEPRGETAVSYRLEHLRV